MAKEIEKHTKAALIEIINANESIIAFKNDEITKAGGIKIGLEDQLKVAQRDLKAEKERLARLCKCVESISSAINTGVQVMFTENVLIGNYPATVQPFDSADTKEFHLPAARLLRHLIAIIEKRGY